MLPEEDRRALRKNGYNISAKGVISPIAHPLQTYNRKTSSSEVQLYRQGERNPSNNSPRPQPKPTPTASNNRRYGSADAAERWSAGASPKPQPTPTPTASNNRRYGSADATERWTSGSSPKPKPTPTPTALNTRRYGSADAAEKRSNPANSRGYNIRSGDTLSAIAQRELGSSSRWREIKKADGSSFSASEAGRLQVGQQVSVPGNSSSTNNRTGGQTPNLRGMSADGAAAWNNAVGNRGGQTAPQSSVSQISSGVGNTVRGIDFGQRQRYQLEPQRGGTVTGIRDTHAGRVKGNPPRPVGSPLIRFDVPDNKTKYPHININPALTGKPDPHTRISPTTLRVAGGTARTLETVGRFAKPVAIVTDGIRLADAVRADGGLGRNTAVTAGSVAGGWGGAATGAWAGAQLGATFGALGGPVGAGVGGFVGGIAGGIGGAFGGSELGENVVEWFWK